MPSRRPGHKTDVYDVLMAGYDSIILVLWHVVARTASAFRRTAPYLVSYSFSSEERFRPLNVPIEILESLHLRQYVVLFLTGLSDLGLHAHI